MRTAFIEALSQLAEADQRLWLLTGDLGYSVLERFANRFPQRFVNVGVAEQNMIGLATGLALSGKTAFVYSIANFPIMRCLEQIRNDVCYHHLNVKIVAVGGGLAYGSAGYTHHAVEDLAVMRAMPHMTVVAPGDPLEVTGATQAISKLEGPCYLRLGKGGEPIVHHEPFEFQIGQGIRLREGKDILFISTGAIVAETVKAADTLVRYGLAAGVINMPTLKPMDIQILQQAAESTPIMITVEEHSLIGGLGEAVASALMQSKMQTKPQLIQVGLGESFLMQVGSQSFLRHLHGIDAERLVSLALETVPPAMARI